MADQTGELIPNSDRTELQAFVDMKVRKQDLGQWPFRTEAFLSRNEVSFTVREKR